MYYIYVIIINTYIEHVEMQVYSFFYLSFHKLFVTGC